MIKTVCFIIFIWSWFVANTLGELSKTWNSPPVNLNDSEIRRTFGPHIEDAPTLLERAKRSSEDLQQGTTHDLMMLWSNCRPFHRFMVLLNDARVSLLDSVKMNSLPELTLQHNLSLVRKARLWLRKLKKQIKNVYKSCLSPSSLKLIVERLNITDLSQLTKIYLNRENSSERARHRQSSSDVTRHNISLQGKIDSRMKNFKLADAIPRSKSEMKKHRVSNTIKTILQKIQIKRNEVVLAKTLLQMVSVNGDINVAFVLKELIASQVMSERKLKQSINDRGDNVKVIVGNYKREVPPYFLSVALGARIIKRAIFAEFTSSPRFLTLSRGLSPSILRFGGTSANCLLFEDSVKEGDVYPSSDFSKSNRPKVISREEGEEILWQSDEGASNISSSRVESSFERSDSPSQKANSSQIPGLSTKRGDLSQRTDFLAKKTALSSSMMFKDREIPKQSEDSIQRRHQMQQFKDQFLSVSLQNNSKSKPESEKGETDCVFDFPYHALYKTKPLNDTYNVLAALVAASRKSSVSDGFAIRDISTANISSTANVSLATNDSSATSNISDSDYSLQDDPKDILGKDLSNITMTAKDWSLLNDFAQDVGMTLLFDVNQIHRIPSERSEWDPTNARKIFKAAFDRNDSILWQLGNEPNAYHHIFNISFSGAEDAHDFGVFHNELKQFFPQPIIVGPDTTTPRQKLFEEEGRFYGLGTPPVEFLEDFLVNLNVNISAITWHHYYINGRTATIDDFLSSELLDQLIWQVTQIVNTRDKLSPNTPVWLTETSSAFGGGAKNLSNRYTDGFLWLDKLGVAASMGIDVVTRQTLIQDTYGLIDDDLNPLPSYWLSFIHKTLVGQRVLNLKIEGASRTTRIYSHCQKPSLVHSYVPGNIVLFGMNLANTSVDVTVEDIMFPHFIEEYLLEPAKGNLQSSVVLLNGVELLMTSDSELPALRSVILPEQTIHIPPFTFGFWVLVNSGVEDCIIP